MYLVLLQIRRLINVDGILNTVFNLSNLKNFYLCFSAFFFTFTAFFFAFLLSFLPRLNFTNRIRWHHQRSPKITNRVLCLQLESDTVCHRVIVVISGNLEPRFTPTGIRTVHITVLTKSPAFQTPFYLCREYLNIFRKF